MLVVWAAGVGLILATMLPVLVQCAVEAQPGGSLWNRRAAALWFGLLVLIALLWPVAVPVLAVLVRRAV